MCCLRIYLPGRRDFRVYHLLFLAALVSFTSQLSILSPSFVFVGFGFPRKGFV